MRILLIMIGLLACSDSHQLAAQDSLLMKCHNFEWQWERCENREVVCYSHGVNTFSCIPKGGYR